MSNNEEPDAFGLYHRPVHHEYNGGRLVRAIKLPPRSVRIVMTNLRKDLEALDGQTIVLPNDVRIEVIECNGDAFKVYQNAIRFADEQLDRVIAGNIKLDSDFADMPDSCPRCDLAMPSDMYSCTCPPKGKP